MNKVLGGEENQPTRALMPWFQGWNVLAVAIGVVAMTMGIAHTSFSFFALEWMAEFGSSRGETMLVLAATQIMAGIFLPFSGRAMDRLSVRWVGLIGVILLACGLALASLATSLWQIGLVYGLILAASEAMAGPIFAQTLAAKWFLSRRGLALGLAVLGTSFGALIFPVAIASLLQEIPWRTTMLLLAAGVFLIALPAVLLVIRDAPRDRAAAPPIYRDGAPENTQWTTAKTLRSPVFWCIVAGFVPLFEASSGLLSNLGPITQDLGIDTRAAGLLISIWSLTVIIGKIAFGILADYYGQRLLYYVSWFPTILGLMLLQMEPSYPLMVIVMVAFGIGSGSNLPLIGVMVSRNFGAVAFGAVMGLLYLCIRPVALAAPLAGWVSDRFGSYDYFWMAMLILCLVCSPAIYFVRDHGHPPGGK